MRRINIVICIIVFILLPIKSSSQICTPIGTYLYFLLKKPLKKAKVTMYKEGTYKRIYELTPSCNRLWIELRVIESEKELHDYNLEKDSLSIPMYKPQYHFFYWSDKGMDEFINNYIDRIEILTDEGNVILADKESIKRFLRKDKKHVKHHRLKYKISRKNIRRWKNQ